MLRRVVKAKDLDKCCRWCHYYRSGKCTHNTFYPEESDLWHIQEEGKLSEVLTESLNSVSLKNVMQSVSNILNTTKIPKSKIESILIAIKRSLEDYKEEAVHTLDNDVGSLYMEYERNQTDITISNPEDTCCSEWC